MNTSGVRKLWRLALLTAVMMQGLVPGYLQAAAFDLGKQRIDFPQQGAAPVRWESCEDICATNTRRTHWFTLNDGGMSFSAPDNPEVDAILKSGVFTFARQGYADSTEIIASSERRVQGHDIVVVYRSLHDNHLVSISIVAPVPVYLNLEGGDVLVPAQLPGFGAIYSKVRAAQFFDGDQLYLEPEPEEVIEAEVPAEAWFGIRNRYWLWYARSPEAINLAVQSALPNRPQIRFQVPADGIQLYAGPTELGALKAASPELSGVLFAAIWDWLRALSFGLLYLLEWLYGLVGNYGFAIILLSLSVKILMYPLTYIADKWQAQVNAITSAMKPKLDEIKRNYKGEEAHNKVLEVYKEHNVTPFYTLRSLFGFLIQIPVFIAAFDMLAENFVLSGQSFLWIADLAKPDHVAMLPFALPFFGGYLNLLPFLMTLLTIVSAIVQEEADLTPDLMRQQRIKLFLMAGAFFLLFYTFPAGMVLYWTANNLFHLLKILPQRLIRAG